MINNNLILGLNSEYIMDKKIGKTTIAFSSNFKKYTPNQLYFYKKNYRY